MRIQDMVEDWRAMKTKLEHQLESLDDDFHQAHGAVPRETVKRWIVELDDIIINMLLKSEPGISMRDIACAGREDCGRPGLPHKMLKSQIVRDFAFGRGNAELMDNYQA